MKKANILIISLIVIFIFSCGSSADLHWDDGVKYRDQQDYENALKEFKEVLRLKPGLPEVYFNIGFCYSVLENYDKAIKFFMTASELRKSDVDCVALADCYLKNYNYDNAIAYYLKAIQMNNTVVDYFLWIGNAYVRKCDLFEKAECCDSAIIYLDKALELGGYKKLIYNHLGASYELKKEYDKSILFYLQAF